MSHVLRQSKRRSIPIAVRVDLGWRFHLTQPGREALSNGPCHGACTAADGYSTSDISQEPLNLFSEPTCWILVDGLMI